MPQSSQSPSKRAVFGVIGGSGVYGVDGLTLVRESEVRTPFGDPSDAVMEFAADGRTFFFIPRHGRGHRLTPSEVNYRANVHALKQMGVTHLLAISAVGIMQEHIRPGDLVVPDQIFDRTKGVRASTFFGDGVVGHVPFADPFCQGLSAAAGNCGESERAKVHRGGTYVCMEGPQFSTRAESRFYRSALQATVIGMTALPEAKLAREAEMCYAMVALATDYDCWNEQAGDVSVEAVLAVLKANSTLAGRLIKSLNATLPLQANCACQSAAQHAIMTARDRIPPHSLLRLATLYGHYLNG